jgi:hypothetical protein
MEVWSLETDPEHASNDNRTEPSQSRDHLVCVGRWFLSGMNFDFLLKFPTNFSPFSRRNFENVSALVSHKWSWHGAYHKALVAKQVRNGCRKLGKVRWLQKVCIPKTLPLTLKIIFLFFNCDKFIESSSRCFSHLCVKSLKKEKSESTMVLDRRLPQLIENSLLSFPTFLKQSKWS